MFVNILDTEYTVDFEYQRKGVAPQITICKISKVLSRDVDGSGKIVNMRTEHVASFGAECVAGDNFVRAVGREIALDLCMKDTRKKKIFNRDDVHDFKKQVFQTVRHSTKEQRDAHRNA